MSSCPCPASPCSPPSASWRPARVRRPRPRTGAGPGQGLSEVVVTGAPYVVSLDSTTTSVDVIKRDALDLAPVGRAWATCWRHLPGVRSTVLRPGRQPAGDPRAWPGPRVLVLTNGIGLIDASACRPTTRWPPTRRRPSGSRCCAARRPGLWRLGHRRHRQRHRRAHPDGNAGRRWTACCRPRPPASMTAGRLARADRRPSAHRDQRRRREEARPTTTTSPSPAISQRLAACGGHRARAGRDPAQQLLELDSWGVGASWTARAASSARRSRTCPARYGTAAEPDVSIDLEQTRVDVRGELALRPRIVRQADRLVGRADYTHTEFEGPGIPAPSSCPTGRRRGSSWCSATRDGWHGAFGVQAPVADVRRHRRRGLPAAPATSRRRASSPCSGWTGTAGGWRAACATTGAR